MPERDHAGMTIDCPDIVDLERYVLREMDETEFSSVAAHLRECGQCAEQVGDLRENLDMAAALRAGGNDHADAPMPETIGPYRIIRKLGQGGMGTVYEAQQENPGRAVALKMLRPGLVSRPLLARFRHEAQVLGRLRHPGIAQIYEAGTHRTDQGHQPYFVMELVGGETLIHFAASRKLARRARLELLAKICDAVHHAHQRGVIHRDLKPDNILVDDSSGEAQPKILDFGVARVIDPEGRTTTLHTSVGQLVGTVAYMSPEQASGEPSEIDIRADVYALGVIAYELLSGRLPYRVTQASVAESIRAIVQDEPAPLSTVDRSLRGDVTTIVTKALEKEKARRYQSAAEMSADIRRYLRDEPILAHRPSTVYQLRKFARRNKGLVGGVIAAVVLLVLGVIGTTIGMVRAQHARVAAENSASEARRESAKASAVNEFLVEMLGSASPTELTRTDRAKGPTITMIEVLDEASQKLEAGSLKAQPAIEAAVRGALGQSYRELGQFERAEAHLRAALALDQQVYGPAHADTAAQQMLLGLTLHSQSRLDEAEACYRDSLQTRRAVFGEPSRPVADCITALAAIARDRGNLSEAESLMNRSLDMHTQALGAEHRIVASDLVLLAVVLEKAGKYPDAEPLYRRAIDIHQKAFGEDHPLVATDLDALSALLYKQGKWDESEVASRSALAIREKLLGADHPGIADVLNNLAAVLHQRKKYDEAERAIRRAIDIERRTYGDDHEDVAASQINLATLLVQQRKFAEAEPIFQNVIRIQRARLGPDHPQLGSTLNNFGGLLRDQERYAEAEPFFREALEIRRKRLGEDHPDVGITMHNFASLLRDLKRPADAEPYHRQSLAILEAKLGPKHPTTAMLRAGLGGCLMDLGRPDEAEPLLASALDVLRSSFGDDDKRLANIVRRLITIYESRGQLEQANALRPLMPATNPTTNSATAAR